VISVVPPGLLLGDYNHNGAVDAPDYVLWRKMLGQLVPPGSAADGNGNGAVDFGDYNVWRAHFAQPASSVSGASANAAVPEPETAVLVIFALVGLCLRGGGPHRMHQQLADAWHGSINDRCETRSLKYEIGCRKTTLWSI
jgi:hypothetical protein